MRAWFSLTHIPILVELFGCRFVLDNGVGKTNCILFAHLNPWKEWTHFKITLKSVDCRPSSVIKPTITWVDFGWEIDIESNKREFNRRWPVPNVRNKIRDLPSSIWLMRKLPRPSCCQLPSRNEYNTLEGISHRMVSVSLAAGSTVEGGSCSISSPSSKFCAVSVVELRKAITSYKKSRSRMQYQGWKGQEILPCYQTN